MSNNFVIELTPAEAAERAAWMLRGQYLGEGKVSVPGNNANEHTVNSVVSMLKATWQEIEDELSSEEPSEEVERNRDLYLSTLQEQIEGLVRRQAETSSRLEPSQDSVAVAISSRDPKTPQEEFERLLAEGFTALVGKNFSNVDFSNRSLLNLTFNHSDLSGANFDNCRLYGCSFEQANLRGASFKNAQMPGVDLSSTCLSKANFESANLCGTRIDWANLRDAMLCGANLSHANLESSNLKRADCSNADFSDANLSSTNLEFAKCIGSQFVRAKLTRAYLEGAKLAGAKFNDADLTDASLFWCKGFNPDLHENVQYGSTKMPDGKIRKSTETTVMPAGGLAQDIAAIELSERDLKQDIEPVVIPSVEIIESTKVDIPFGWRELAQVFVLTFATAGGICLGMGVAGCLLYAAVSGFQGSFSHRNDEQKPVKQLQSKPLRSHKVLSPKSKLSS